MVNNGKERRMEQTQNRGDREVDRRTRRRTKGRASEKKGREKNARVWDQGIEKDMCPSSWPSIFFQINQAKFCLEQHIWIMQFTRLWLMALECVCVWCIEGCESDFPAVNLCQVKSYEKYQHMREHFFPLAPEIPVQCYEWSIECIMYMSICRRG